MRPSFLSRFTRALPETLGTEYITPHTITGFPFKTPEIKAPTVTADEPASQKFLEARVGVALPGSGSMIMPEVVQGLLNNIDVYTHKDVKKALEIKKTSDGTSINSGDVGTNQYAIVPRDQGLYTTNLRYCCAIIFIGEKEMALAHLSHPNDDMAKMLFDRINPHQIISYSSIPGISSSSDIASEDLRETLRYINSYAKKRNEPIKHDFLEYVHTVSNYGNSIFVKGSKDKASEVVTLSSNQNSRLQRLEMEEELKGFNR